MQGKDELEYANKNVQGDFSFTGSIYLSAYNSPDFSDAYNLIYGHHVDNGSMFGDLDLFLKEGFLENHRIGYLITEDVAYKLNFFAVAETNAYNRDFYRPWEISEGRLSSQVRKIENIAEYFIDGVANGDTHLVALSTCTDGQSYGRIILFGTMIPYDGDIHDIIDDDIPKDDNSPDRESQGHGIKY